MLGNSKSGRRFDLTIRNGRVVDGAGNTWFRADIGIEGGKIAKIGNVSSPEGRRAIDARGMVVCPGFIDIHQHSDTTLLINPKCESMVRQGVTTQVVGNCGLSCAPVSDATRDLLEGFLFGFMPKTKIDWHTFGEYLNRLEQRGVATNVAALVGHGAVRIAVLGSANRLPTANELGEMKRLVASAMEDGAFGMSTGLGYAPGMFSDTNEIIELTEVVARHGGLYATHVRNEATGLAWEKSVREAIETAEKTGVRLQVSHIESHYPNWRKQEGILKMLEDARATGVDVTTDVPPYLCGYTTVAQLLPDWALAGGRPRILGRLGHPETRDRIRKWLPTASGAQPQPAVRMVADGLANKIWVGDSKKNPDLVGASLAEIGELRARHPFDAALDLILEEEGLFPIMCELHLEDDIRKVVEHPLSMIGSDGYACAPYGTLAEAKPHPRNYGVFPHTFTKYVRGDTRKEEPKEVGERLITLEEAVRKMTSFPAQKLGLRDRGLIREGMAADIVIFDPERIEDLATYANPHQYPKGIPYVLVNGLLVVEDGEHIGTVAGKVLRSSAAL